MKSDDVEVWSTIAATFMVLALLVAGVLAGFGRFVPTVSLLLFAVACAVIIAVLSLVRGDE